MVQTLCKTCSEPQGITHSVSAFWLAPKQDSAHADLIVIRTNVLDVYTVLKRSTSEAQPQHEGHCPSHTLLLEHSQELHGEVQAITCLTSRRAGHRDSIVLAFDAVRVVEAVHDHH
jgi:hypothetical protein